MIESQLKQVNFYQPKHKSDKLIKAAILYRLPIAIICNLFYSFNICIK